MHPLRGRQGLRWCNGCNYDFADSDTIFQRATFICKMHKANARANEYFWKRFSVATAPRLEKDKLRAGSLRGEQSPHGSCTS